MKSSTKEKIKIGLIIASSIIIAVVTLSIFTGRLQTENIVVVDADDININAPLGQQVEKFKVIEISKKEYDLFNGSVVTSLDELMDKRINFQLTMGSPIPRDALLSEGEAGQFASTLPEGKTVHMFPQAAVNLPPVSRGDLINVGITFEDQTSGLEKDIKSSIFLYDLEVINVIQGNIYVIVSLEESLLINSASSIGSFFFQLPGRMALPLCSELEEKERESLEAESDENVDEVEETEIGRSEDDEEAEDEAKEEQTALTVECLDDNYQPKEVSSTYILNELRRGNSLNLSKRDLEREIKRLNDRLDEIEEVERDDSDVEEENQNDSNNPNVRTSREDSNDSCDLKVVAGGFYVPSDHEDYDSFASEEVLYYLCSEEEAEDEGLTLY